MALILFPFSIKVIASSDFLTCLVLNFDFSFVIRLILPLCVTNLSIPRNNAEIQNTKSFLNLKILRGTDIHYTFKVVMG